MLNVIVYSAVIVVIMKTCLNGYGDCLSKTKEVR